MFDHFEVKVNSKLDQLSEEDKERLGFYHLVLENITGVIDSLEDNYAIIDTQYNKLVNNITVDDLGIDAVNYYHNDNGEIDIQLFNFKYRKTFNSDKTKSEKDISRSTKFLEYIVADELLKEDENKLVHEQINRIIMLNASNKVCNISLYMVSNEGQSFAPSSNKYIEILEKSYGMRIINISLDDIISFYNPKKEQRKSSFMISPDEFLSFESDERSTQKSYILKLSLLDLIRITSENEELANLYSIEDDEQLIDSRLDFSLLYDNVRGYLGETKYNKNIIETLSDNHNYFFMFNNGVTITAESIEVSPKNSGKKYLFKIGNFQIVNGGQTIRSVYNFLQEDFDIAKILKLREAYVLLRLFKTSREDTLQNSIAEYTNSQNAISEIDLKSIDNIQIQIEKYFEEYDIMYVRKAGNIGGNDKDYSFRISMEKMAQVLYSALGHPDRASSQKKRLFQDYYNEIFKSDSFSIEDFKQKAEEFQNVEYQYKIKNPHLSVSDQKEFYIIYITTFTALNIQEAIEKLEELLKTYPSDSETPDSRKLIQKGFKIHVNEVLEIK